MIHLFKPTAIMIITFIVSFQGQQGTGTLYQVAFVLVQIFHYLKITVSQLLEMIDRCHSFIFFIIIYLICIYVYMYILYLLRNNFIFYFSISIFISFLSYYCISDIVIYLIYVDLMRKRCQLINVDVDLDVDFRTCMAIRPPFECSEQLISTRFIFLSFKKIQ